MVRHSTGMMVGGIVAVSFAPVALLVAGIAGLGKSICRIDNDYPSSCDREYDTTIYGSLITAAVLVPVGVTLIVVGAKKEPLDPDATASITPWATPSAGGVAVHVQF